MIDEEGRVRCVDRSYGTRREEVWKHDGKVVRYNLAFIHHHSFQRDHGRVLGYDNAHGFHERHRMGSVERVAFSSYDGVLARFQEELMQ